MSSGLSIILPTINRPQCLVRCLDSVVDQCASDDEIIVIDQSPAVNAEVRTSYPHVQFVTLSPPGLPAARNTGLSVAQYERVVFIDDDSVAQPGWLEAYRIAHSTYPNAAIAGRIHQADGGFCSGEPCVSRINLDTLETIGNFDSDSSQQTLYATGGNFSILKTHARAVRGFNPRYRGNALYEDVDFSVRLRAMGTPIRYIPSALINHYPQTTGGCQMRTGVHYLIDRLHNWTLFALLHAGGILKPTRLAYLRNLIEFTTRNERTGHSPILLARCLGALTLAYWNSLRSPGPRNTLARVCPTGVLP